MTTSSAIRVEFRRSLPAAIILDATRIAIANDYEGFDPWIYSVRASMPADLRDEIEWLFNPFGASILMPHAVASPSSEETISTVIRWLGQIDNKVITKGIEAVCRELSAHLPDRGTKQQEKVLADASSLRAFLQTLADNSLLSERGIEPLTRLLRRPEEFKAEVTYVLSRFWDRYMKAEYAKCRPLEEQSVDRYRQSPPTGSAKEIFEEVCGRDYPEEHAPPAARVERMCFVPCCHCGPYVSITDAEEDGKSLMIVYNCRPSAENRTRTTLPVDEISRPLKALADETRLEILAILTEGEHYAQQIVDRMQISQSAVSRHLRLMVACGVLRVRKQEGMKFYSIDDKKIANLIAHLDTLRRAAQD